MSEVTQSPGADLMSGIGVNTARILVADPIAADGVERLRAGGEVDVKTGMSRDELIACIGDYDALVVRSETKVDAGVLAAASRLRVVGRAGVGVDNIDLDAATEHGVLVLNAPTGNTVAAAEHAIAMLLAASRNIPAADASMRAARWDRKKFVGTELRDKTLGVVGLGKIGFEVARIASEGLRMKVIAFDPLATPQRADQAGATLVDLDTVFTDSDAVTLHVPVTDATRNLVDAKRIASMRKGARLINVARGGIVDEAALADAVRSGHLAGAAIDVFGKEPVEEGNPLLSVPQIVVTPHLGASTAEAQINVAADVADQIVEYLGGGSPRYAVNAPAVPPEELARLRPYLRLGLRIGELAAQLLEGGPQRLTCSFAGEVGELNTQLVTAEILRGLLTPYTDTRVNAVNAKTVAASLGVEVDERRTTKRVDHANAVLVEVRGEAPLTIWGTAFEGEPHITRINGLRLDMQPEGTFLVVSHNDRPGVIAAVATLLAKHDVNIAGIELGRERPRGRAVMVMQIDEPVSQALLDEIREVATLETLRMVRL